MSTLTYDTSTEVSTAEAARLLRRSLKTVQAMWRAGQLHGRMQKTIHDKPWKLWISRESIDARLRDEARSPLDRARKGQKW